MFTNCAHYCDLISPVTSRMSWSIRKTTLICLATITYLELAWQRSVCMSYLVCCLKPMQRTLLREDTKLSPKGLCTSQLCPHFPTAFPFSWVQTRRHYKFLQIWKSSKTGIFSPLHSCIFWSALVQIGSVFFTTQQSREMDWLCHAELPEALHCLSRPTEII